LAATSVFQRTEMPVGASIWRYGPRVRTWAFREPTKARPANELRRMGNFMEGRGIMGW
jgi:hypothetical protein